MPSGVNGVALHAPAPVVRADVGCATRTRQALRAGPGPASTTAYSQ
jgi:hypothetical protein